MVQKIGTINTSCSNTTNIKVRIIYYSDYLNKEKPYYYYFTLSPDYKMLEILNKLYLFIKLQLDAITLCFGSDIASIIHNFMPNMFDKNNNNLYLHDNTITKNKKNRIFVNNDTTLDKVNDTIQDYNISQYINLRLRGQPMDYRYFTKFI